MSYRGTTAVYGRCGSCERTLDTFVRFSSVSVPSVCARRSGADESVPATLATGARPRLSEREERRLARRARRGDEAAFEELVRANLPLVFFFAGRYAGLGVPLADLVQEGALGLVVAARRFDPERERRFSVFARWHIRGAMTKALTRRSRLIRM